MLLGMENKFKKRKQEIQKQISVLWNLGTRKVQLEGGEFGASRSYLVRSCLNLLFQKERSLTE